ncbi:MAG: peroxiredoxin family protein [Acidimicrobiia bacterium]|nr:peroxiredoxin family protein [Acidimicrobiia bacterium]NNK91607.1 redoxin domain-containing protein [Acidimicrobiia bacterium]
MQQIVDLENDNQFAGLDVELVSIAFDSPEVLSVAGAEYGVGPTPLLSDPDGSVSEAYDVLQWAVATGEPGHTFVLVDREGRVAWIQDYGAPENRGVMYVETSEIASEVGRALAP